MMTIPPTKYPRRRRHRFKSRAAQPTPPPPEPLVLQSIASTSFGSEGGNVQVVFDTTPEAPLADASSADPQKWTVRYGEMTFEGSALEVVAYNRIDITFIRVGSATGADVLNYAADPSDIADTSGRQLAAFSDRPL